MARAECREEHEGDLASVPDQDTNNFLASLTTSRVWIGGHDSDQEGTWAWSDGTPWDFQNWASGEPGNHNNVTDQDYLYINYQSAGLWDDAGTEFRTGFICQQETSDTTSKIVCL